MVLIKFSVDRKSFLRKETLEWLDCVLLSSEFELIDSAFKLTNTESVDISINTRTIITRESK